jgi:hypothetical protein
MAPISVRYSRSATAAKAIVQIPWVAGAILRIAPALGTLGIFHPSDPSVLLIFILESVSCGLVG